MDSAAFIGRLLDVIETALVPLTRERVAAGNKVFGAAILRKSDLGTVVVETNNEIENPLWHGEIHAIKRFYELPAEARPSPENCIFLATHEPCSLCLSGITWAGFDNFHYLFAYEETRDAFGIPHDIRILREVYAVPDPDREAAASGRPLYNRSNAFWQSHGIMGMIAGLDRGSRETLLARIDEIRAAYGELSADYQAQKGGRGIPLA